MAIKCGNCKHDHETVDQVRVCYGLPPHEPLDVQDWSELKRFRVPPKQWPDAVPALPPEVDELFPVTNIHIPKVVSEPVEIRTVWLPKVVHLPEAGTYTVVDPATEEYRTIEVEVGKGNWENRLVLSYLCGPDNGLDFMGFAHVDMDTGRLFVWKRFKSDSFLVKMAQALLALAADKEGLAMAGELYALKSSRCTKCRRKLTVPASIHRGMGPDCAEKWGM